MYFFNILHIGSDILANFALSSIIPSSTMLSKKGYSRYIGSLTTPPCTEGIIWTVYNTKINISASQVIKEIIKN